MYKVAKPFKTDVRRFAADQEVTPADITGPTSFDDWMARGFIAAVVVSATAKEPPKKPGLNTATKAE